MDGHEIWDAIIAKAAPTVEKISHAVKHGVDLAWYTAMDRVTENRNPDEPLDPAQEAWDGLVNLVNIDAPEKDIKEQEEAYSKLLQSAPEPEGIIANGNDYK